MYKPVDIELILIDCGQRLQFLWPSTQTNVVYELVSEALSIDTEYLAQFLRDCSVLPHVINATQSHGSEILQLLFHLTRSWCFSIHRQRTKMLGRWNFQYLYQSLILLALAHMISLIHYIYLHYIVIIIG